jgi:hypothetical protein
LGDHAVDIIESLLDRGFEPAIRIKETMRMSIRHPLRKLSNENWKRYGRMRYRVEQLFGSIKQKIGSSFKCSRQLLASMDMKILQAIEEILNRVFKWHRFPVSLFYCHSGIR